MTPNQLAELLGYQFRQTDLLTRALTHRSASADNNERLEFLGDAVLSIVIADVLFKRFPLLSEGELSRQRANLVRQEFLAQVARNLCLQNVVRLGEGERRSGGAQRPSILSDALEALFGAIYLDGGYEAIQAVILRLFNAPLNSLDPRVSGKDSKTLLQEFLQGRHIELPQYTLVATRGEAHKQEFEVECHVAHYQLRCAGVGHSRRIAEQMAATAVLAKLTKDHTI